MRYFNLALVLLGLTFTTTASAQFIYVEDQGNEASNIFDQCDQVDRPYQPGIQVTGFSFSYDADTYCFLTTDWTLPVLSSSWVQSLYASGNIGTTELYVNSVNNYEYSVNSEAANQARVFSLNQPESATRVGLSDQGSVLRLSPDRLESDGTSTQADRTYTLTIDQPRPHQRIQELTDLNQRDASLIAQVAECDADLWTWRYRDLELGTFEEPGEQFIAGVQLPHACLERGFQFRSQSIVVVLVVNPQTGFQYLVKLFDYNDPHPIGDTTPGNYGDWAPVILPGELSALVPNGDPDPILMVGVMAVSNDQSSVGTEVGQPTVVFDARSAHPVREAIVAIEVVNPRVDYDVAQLSVDKVADVDSIDVTLPVSSSHQTFGFDVTLTRLQDGRFNPAGSVVLSDTLQALNPRNAVNRLHADNGYTLTRRLAVSDLRVGDQLQVDIVPIGRGVYSDTLRLDALAQTTTLTLPFGTPTTDRPQVQPLTLSVFPNPTTSGQVALAISSVTVGNVQFTVFDTVGRQIAHGRVQVTAGETQISLDLTGVTPGVYVVHATSNNGQVATQRLTVVR